jgi:hypothetical protein
MWSRRRRIATAAAAMMIVGAALVVRAPSQVDRQATAEPGSAGTAGSPDRVARLQQKLDGGGTPLIFERDHGYLRSLLENLEIPTSSQVLVFSKSSAQMGGIAPEKPRAIYFNDDTYVGWVDGGGLELASVDPADGPYFYTLTQAEDPRPTFERHTDTCVGCHDSSEDPARLIPRLLKLSVLPDRNGLAIQGAALATTDRSPFRERWGGWYVTGTHGRQLHMGNQTFRAPATEFRSIPDVIAQLDLSPGSNITDLSRYFDTKRYLTPHSDIVALMILGHQTHVQNLMAVATYKLRYALEDDPKTDVEALAKELGEPIVRALLFSGEARLTDPVTGTSGFAAEFERLGPRDSRGRSLRELDLKTRLLRYPLSYMIYAASFDEMPAPVKEYIGLRLRDVLSGRDTTAPYAHLSAADREQISVIVRETKPDLGIAAPPPTSAPR